MFQSNFQLNPNEKVILYVRKHWIFFIADVVSILALFLFPSAIIWFLQFAGWLPNYNIFGITVSQLSDILVYMWGIFAWLMLAERFTDYALDFWVLTNKRIVESELIKLFNHKISTLELQDIEDITIHEAGIWANYFDFGSLEVQTAGTRTEFHAENIASPEEVQKIIFESKLEEQQKEKDLRREEIEDISHKVMDEDKEKIERQEPKEVQKEMPKETPKEETNFDWAHIDERQKSDERNVTEKLEEVEDKYKNDIDSALRTE